MSGAVIASTSDGASPVPAAGVRLFLADENPDDALDTRELVAETITSMAGRYCMFLPAPTGAAGVTPPGGVAFELSAAKEGYVTGSTSFRYGYSYWDYGGPTVDLHLVPR